MRFVAISSTARGVIHPPEPLDEMNQAKAAECYDRERLEASRPREQSRYGERIMWTEAGRKLVRQERAQRRLEYGADFL